MPPALRRLALAAHVAFSVGWLGAVAAYLAPAIALVRGHEVEAARASMELIGWYVIVPLSLAALATGLVQSLGTPWGLFRYYWVAAKFVLTVGAVTILLLHMPAVSRLARGELHAPPVPFLMHAAGGLAVLLATTALSIFKPWGKTPYGRRRLPERSAG